MSSKVRGVIVGTLALLCTSVARSTVQYGTVVYVVSYAGGPGSDTLPIDSNLITLIKPIFRQ